MRPKSGMRTLAMLALIVFDFALHAQTTVYSPIASPPPFTLTPISAKTEPTPAMPSRSWTSVTSKSFVFDVSLSSLECLTIPSLVPSALVITSDFRTAPASISSPARALTLDISVEQSHIDPRAHGCVIFDHREASGRVAHRENPFAPNIQPWSIRWLFNDQVQISSSDVEAGNAKIDALVKTFEGSSLWSGSSVCPVIALPSEASITEVLNRFQTTGFGRFTSYRIIASKTASIVLDHVPVRPDGTTEWTPVKEPITVVLIATDVGEKIFFMHYSKQNGWATDIRCLDPK